MAVRIRLTRVGATKRPSYRVVAIDSRRARDGRALEILGFYDPLTEPAVVQIDAPRLKVWLGNGARPSDTVMRLMRQAGVAPDGTQGPRPEPRPAPKPKPKRVKAAKAAAAKPAAAAAVAEEPAAEAAAEAEPAEAVEATTQAEPEATAEAAPATEAEAPVEAEPAAEAPKRLSPRGRSARRGEPR